MRDSTTSRAHARRLLVDEAQTTTRTVRRRRADEASIEQTVRRLERNTRIGRVWTHLDYCVGFAPPSAVFAAAALSQRRYRHRCRRERANNHPRRRRRASRARARRPIAQTKVTSHPHPASRTPHRADTRWKSKTPRILSRATCAPRRLKTHRLRTESTRDATRCSRLESARR